jgi:hypothetical protein
LVDAGLGVTSGRIPRLFDSHTTASWRVDNGRGFTGITIAALGASNEALATIIAKSVKLVR